MRDEERERERERAHKTLSTAQFSRRDRVKGRQLYACVYTHAHIHTQAYTLTHKYTHIYMYTHSITLSKSRMGTESKALNSMLT